MSNLILSSILKTVILDKIPNVGKISSFWEKNLISGNKLMNRNREQI